MIVLGIFFLLYHAFVLEKIFFMERAVCFSYCPTVLYGCCREDLSHVARFSFIEDFVFQYGCFREDFFPVPRFSFIEFFFLVRMFYKRAFSCNLSCFREYRSRTTCLYFREDLSIVVYECFREDLSSAVSVCFREISPIG